MGLLAPAATSGGNGHEQRAAGIKVGVSLAGYSTDFWSSYVSFEKAAATKYGVSLVGPISSNGDAGKQATQIRTLIDEGVNALIINPVDSAAIAPTLSYAASKHIPVVSVDVAPTKGSVYMIVRADNILFSNDGTPQEHGWIRAGEEDATISQPANLYAGFAVFYAKQATTGAKYKAGMSTDHGSKIVNLLGNLEDAIVAPVVSKSNVNDPALWGNYKQK